jgi:peptidoglycan hydrolase CwlO-like protein
MMTTVKTTKSKGMTAMPKKVEKPAAADDAQATRIAGLEANIEKLSKQLEDALKKKHADPDLVDSLTSRIAGLEAKIEETEKLSRIERPDDEEDEPEAGKKTAAKKKSGEGVGMF